MSAAYEGKIPLDLAVLCQDCSVISAVRREPRRSCPACASENVLELEPVLNREADATAAAWLSSPGIWKLDPDSAYLVRLPELLPPDGMRALAARLTKEQEKIGRVVMVMPIGLDKLYVVPGPVIAKAKTVDLAIATARGGMLA